MWAMFVFQADWAHFFKCSYNLNVTVKVKKLKWNFIQLPHRFLLNTATVCCSAHAHPTIRRHALNAGGRPSFPSARTKKSRDPTVWNCRHLARPTTSAGRQESLFSRRHDFTQTNKWKSRLNFDMLTLWGQSECVASLATNTNTPWEQFCVHREK